jgi:rubrerythrin
MSLKKFLGMERETPKTTEFLGRRMQDKLSVYKCCTCEDSSKKGHAIPFLFHKTGRGNKCPICGNSKMQKISIRAVMQLRWNKAVRQQLLSLRN